MNKSKLRKTLRARRNALAPAAQRRAARGLAARLRALPAFARSKRIALYFANDGEIDPARAWELCAARGKQCYAPVIIAGKKAGEKSACVSRACPRGRACRPTASAFASRMCRRMK